MRRPDEQREADGVAELKRGARRKGALVPLNALPLSISRQLRRPNDIAAQMLAVQIASLDQVSTSFSLQACMAMLDETPNSPLQSSMPIYASHNSCSMMLVKLATSGLCCVSKSQKWPTVVPLFPYLMSSSLD